MDKKELLERIITDDMPYRDKLEIPSKIGIGFEIEAGLNYRDKALLSDKFNNSKWDVGNESSILCADSFELSSPVFYNRHSTWKKLKGVSRELKKWEASFSEASFQVNIDNILDKKSIINFIKLVAAYEDVIYSFSRGSDDYLRDVVSYYADTIGFIVYNNVYSTSYYHEDNLIRKLLNNKSYSISLKSENVIEFRTPNSTFEAWLWQNYVNTFVNMIISSKNKELDEDKLKKYISKFSNPYFVNYDENELYLDKAIEFSDIIFDDDVDKMYFMKQYLHTVDNENIKKLIKIGR